MSTDRLARSYFFHETKLEVLCSAEMAECLDLRFRMFPREAKCTDTIRLDFRAAVDPGRHAFNRPQGQGRSFYEMPKGEACYFREADEIYLSFGDGVRALCGPRSGEVLVSTVEREPRNVFVASHLVLTILLVEMLRRRGWYALHAAGFSHHGCALLIAGTSGSGKSTLSVALLRAKFDYLSDDMVLLGQCRDSLAVRGFVEDVDVSDQTIRFFPELNFLLQSRKRDGFTKRRLGVQEVYATNVVCEAHPGAIILPRISGKQESVIQQIDGDEAFLEIVPNVLLTEESTCQRHLAVLAELVKKVKCYRLDAGQDFDRIAVLLRRLLTCQSETVCA